MGYNIEIGRVFLDTRDRESHVWTAIEEYDPESPFIPGINSYLSGYNRMMASYTGAQRLCESAGILDVFYPDDRNFCGPDGYIVIDRFILDTLDKAVASYPEKEPHDWWGIAVLEWMWFWCHKAYRQHSSPVLIAR